MAHRSAAAGQEAAAAAPARWARCVACTVEAAATLVSVAVFVGVTKGLRLPIVRGTQVEAVWTLTAERGRHTASEPCGANRIASTARTAAVDVAVAIFVSVTKRRLLPRVWAAEVILRGTAVSLAIDSNQRRRRWAGGRLRRRGR
eukprot:812938-Prymnesium_polylepis.1